MPTTCCVSVTVVAVSVMSSVLSNFVAVARLVRAAVWYCVSLVNMDWLALNSCMCATYPDVYAVIFDLWASSNLREKKVFQLSRVFSHGCPFPLSASFIEYHSLLYQRVSNG